MNGFTTYRYLDGCYNHQVTVAGMISAEKNERHVFMTHRSGGLNFQFNMTPDQARKLSEALLDSAFEIENLKVEE